MNGFSDRDKQRILGSESKLNDWQNGDSAESIFNRVRPKYPISKAKKFLRYNTDMKPFTINNLTNNKIRAINSWVSDSSEIKKYMWFNSYRETLVKQEAEILFKLFDDYKCNVKKRNHFV